MGVEASSAQRLWQKGAILQRSSRLTRRFVAGVAIVRGDGLCDHHERWR